MPIKLTMLWPVVRLEIQTPEFWILYYLYVMEVSRLPLLSIGIKLVQSVISRELLISPCRRHLCLVHRVVLHMPLTVLTRSPSASGKLSPCPTCSHAALISEAESHRRVVLLVHMWAPSSIWASAESWRHPCGAGRCGRYLRKKCLPFRSGIWRSIAIPCPILDMGTSEWATVLCTFFPDVCI